MLSILYWQAFWNDSVMTTRLLWMGLVKAYIVSWFCIGAYLVVFVEGSVIVWLCLSWRLLSSHLWYVMIFTSLAKQYWLNFLSPCSIPCCCIFLLKLIGFCWQMHLVLGCHCEVLHLGGQFILSLTFSSVAPNPTADTSVSKYRSIISSKEFHSGIFFYDGFCLVK